MFEQEFNFVSEENNVKINYCSSQTKGCDCKNILSNNRKSIWLSEKSVPQIIIIDLSKMEKKPENFFFKYFAIYCWHAYSTNPKIIQILVSENNKKYFDLGDYELAMSPKIQYFQIENLDRIKNKGIKFIKLIIKETFGGSRTYINQIFFYDEQSKINNETEENFPTITNNEIDENNNNIDEKYFKQNTFEIEDGRNYFNKNMNKKSNRKTDELDEEEKERKLKKIEKILKTKILSNNINLENESLENDITNRKINKNLLINPDDENEDDKIYSNLNQYLSHANSNFNSAKNKNIEYNNNYINYNNRTENTFSPEITNSSNFNIPKRIMTPIPKGSKLIFKSPDNTISYINTNPNTNYKISLNSDKEYKRLEAQLKEMEDRLKSLNTENNNNSNINNINNSNSKNITHSKSFSFLPKEQNNSLRSNKNNNYINIQKEINDNYNNYVNNDTLNLPVQSTNRNFNINTNSNRQFIENLNNLNTNRILPSERVNSIEQRMSNLENEIKGIKDQFTTLSKNIQLLVNMKSNNNNINTEQIIQIVLKECIKLIENKFNEIQFQYQNNQITNNRMSNEFTSNNNLYVSTDSNLYSFEMRLNKKIDERLDLLANHIQEQLNNNFLKPSIQSIENTMKNNMNEIKEKLNQINTHSNNNLLNQSETSFVESIRGTKSLLNSQSDIKNSTIRRNEQYDEINRLGEKLYDKLVEKEKKLEEFKIETTNYFKKRMKKDNKKLQDSLNSLK